MSKELKIGDEVRVTTDAFRNSCPRGSLGTVVAVGQGFIGAAFNGEYGNDGYPLRLEDGEYELVINDTPKLWRDMSDEEKGALLLAHHEGRVIQNFGAGKNTWIDDSYFEPKLFPHKAYRVKPWPVRETVPLYIHNPLHKKIGTIVLEDGKPDCDSIKMESAT